MNVPKMFRIRWELLLFIVLSIIPIIFLGTSLIADSEPSFQINPNQWLNLLFYGWFPNQLGFPSDFGLSTIPIAIFYSAFSSVLPLWIVERVFFFLIFLTAGYSMFLLAKEFGLAPRHAVISGTLYMFGFVMVLFFKGSSVMLLPYAFCPLILALTMVGIRKQSLRYGLAIGILTCLFAGINPPETIIALAPSMAYLLMKLIEGKNLFAVKFFLVVSVVALAVNLFWILPAYNSLTTGWSDQIWVETPAMHNAYSAYPEIFRQLGYDGFYGGFKGTYYVAFAPDFIGNTFWIMVSFIVPILSLLAIMTKRIQQSQYLMVSLLLIVAIPLAVGAYPPNDPGTTGNVYMWLYNNVPYFMSFRNSYKFVFLISLAFSLLTGVFFESFEGYLRKKYQMFPSVLKRASTRAYAIASRVVARLPRMHNIHKRWSRDFFFKIVVSLFGISIVMISYWPTWTGYIQDKSTSFNVPSYYDEVSNYFADKGDSRILLTPDRYFFPYDWGLLSSEVMASKVKNPLIYDNVGKMGSDPSGDALGKYLTSSIYSNDTAGVPILLRYLGVDYVVQQNDINYSYYDGNSQASMKSILGSIPSLEKVETFGEVDIYKVRSPSGIIEASDHYEISPLGDNQSIDSLVIQRALSYSNLSSDQPIKGLAYLNNTISGNTAINVSALIEAGTNLSVVVYSNESTYYVFQASSNTSGENSIDRYSNGSSVQHSSNNATICQNGQLINVTIDINSGSARLWINGIDAADQTLVNYTGNEFHVGFTSGNSTSMFRSLRVQNNAWSYSTDFQVSDLAGLKNWTIQGNGWAIKAFPIQALDSSGDVPIYLSKEFTTVIDYLKNVTLVKPASISYHLVDPVTTTVDVTGSTGPFLLLMKSTWGDWRASIDGKEINRDYHVRANGFGNAWIVNTTGNYTVVLTYQPHQYFMVGFELTAVSLISVSSAILVFPVIIRHRMNKKSRKE